MSHTKRVMTEFLLLYKEFACLWDTKQLNYNNKEARDKAYDILLEKYRELHEEASILDVKKKIEYMRTTYRREQRKVMQSRFDGDIEEYTPKLWYYELFSFLNDVSVSNKFESIPRTSEEKVSMKIERSEIKPKKRKTALSAVYLPEQDDHFSEDEDEVYAHHDEESIISTANQLAEAEAFGTTIGLQLRELDPMQRVFAEKLISDAMFQARLQKLNENSAIVTNNDSN